MPSATALDIDEGSAAPAYFVSQKIAAAPAEAELAVTPILRTCSGFIGAARVRANVTSDSPGWNPWNPWNLWNPWNPF